VRCMICFSYCTFCFYISVCSACSLVVLSRDSLLSRRFSPYVWVCGSVWVHVMYVSFSSFSHLRLSLSSARHSLLPLSPLILCCIFLTVYVDVCGYVGVCRSMWVCVGVCGCMNQCFSSFSLFSFYLRVCVLVNVSRHSLIICAISLSLVYVGVCVYVCMCVSRHSLGFVSYISLSFARSLYVSLCLSFSLVNLHHHSLHCFSILCAWFVCVCVAHHSRHSLVPRHSITKSCPM